MKIFTNRVIIKFKFSVSFFAAFFSIYLIVNVILKFIMRRQCLQTKTPKYHYGNGVTSVLANREIK